MRAGFQVIKGNKLGLGDKSCCVLGDAGKRRLCFTNKEHVAKKEVTGSGSGRVQVQQRGTEHAVLHLLQHLCYNRTWSKITAQHEVDHWPKISSSSSSSLHMGRAFTVQLLKISCPVYLGRYEVMQLRVTPPLLSVPCQLKVFFPKAATRCFPRCCAQPCALSSFYMQQTVLAGTHFRLSYSHWQTLIQLYVFWEIVRGIYTSQGDKKPNFLLPDANSAKVLKTHYLLKINKILSTM